MLGLHPHIDTFMAYVRHGFFDGLIALCDYYAATYCIHRWHRVSLAVLGWAVGTFALVSLVG